MDQIIQSFSPWIFFSDLLEEKLGFSEHLREETARKVNATATGPVCV